MPIFDIHCSDCGHEGEVLHIDSRPEVTCPECGGLNTEKRMSVTSSLTGSTAKNLPGAGDTGCCGSAPGHAGCAGPGSCCGKT